MRLHRALGDDERGGDFGVGVPLRDEPQYLHLARGQPGGRVAARHGRADLGRQTLRDARVQRGLAPAGGVDGLQHHLGFGILEQIRERAGLDGRENQFVLPDFLVLAAPPPLPPRMVAAPSRKPKLYHPPLL